MVEVFFFVLLGLVLCIMFLYRGDGKGGDEPSVFWKWGDLLFRLFALCGSVIIFFFFSKVCLV